MSELFESGSFVLHSGKPSTFKIDCDALSDVTIHNMAEFIGKRMRFGRIESIPTGGDRLAKALEPWKDHRHADVTLIVDDVLTTGNSMIAKRRDRENVIGVVIFARGPYPSWVRPLFVMPGRWWQ